MARCTQVRQQQGLRGGGDCKAFGEAGAKAGVMGEDSPRADPEGPRVSASGAQDSPAGRV